ncbi:hypothetical protein amb0320 [Paramagnetospirillum magneticum AMB-1]|uniref:Uncharacterized protein n=1 Tax=Paramagnetospirillum magneticum (strain ATCC 700264 / AMB-1) TaxID=342108 RepID=Q2WAK1_PARM1|nr:hypothetical protein amb0320 [Paramagnetospirillum magneticum AMB-1]
MLLAWLTLLPVKTPLPVMAQRRAMVKSSLQVVRRIAGSASRRGYPWKIGPILRSEEAAFLRWRTPPVKPGI